MCKESQQLMHFHPPTLRLACSSVNVRIRRESLDCRLTVELNRRARCSSLALYPSRVRSKLIR